MTYQGLNSCAGLEKAEKDGEGQTVAPEQLEMRKAHAHMLLWQRHHHLRTRHTRGTPKTRVDHISPSRLQGTALTA